MTGFYLVRLGGLSARSFFAHAVGARDSPFLVVRWIVGLVLMHPLSVLHAIA